MWECQSSSRAWAAWPVTLLLALALAPVGCDNPPDNGTPAAPPAAGQWKAFTSKRGGFSIRLPAEPVASVEPTAAEGGALGSSLFRVQVDEATFGVAFTDYPASLVDDDKVESMLEGARDGAARRVEGTVKSDDLINLAGHPGRAVVIESKPNGQAMRIECRFYLVGSRLYQLTVAQPLAAPASDDAATFFDSFTLSGD